MSYVGSTAATSSVNVPKRIDTGLLSQRNVNESSGVENGGSVWSYTSSNLTTDLATAGFFTDAKQLGIRNGDILISATYSTVSSTGFELVLGIFSGLSSTSDAAAISTAAGLISSTFS